MPDAETPKDARKVAGEIADETRVDTVRRDGSSTGKVLIKESDRSKGGARVKVFKG